VVTAPAVRHARGVLDISTVILLSRLNDAALLPDEPLITAVTLAELSVGPLVASNDQERAARQAHVQQAEADFDPLPFDAQAARAFGRVAVSLRRSGRQTKPRAFDAMIAAIALANDLPVYTGNPEDFAGIDGLTVVGIAVPATGVGPVITRPASISRRHQRLRRTGRRRLRK
jgi:predicted nucleic acid-binding protein